jgi:hypothetical protein
MGYGEISYATTSYAAALITTMIASQISFRIVIRDELATQVEAKIANDDKLASQIQAKITSDDVFLSQISARSSFGNILASQIQAKSSEQNSLKSEVRRGKIRHRVVGYSMPDYASFAYNVASFSLDLNSQIQSNLINTPPKLSQVEQILSKQNSLRSEIRRGKLRHRVVGYAASPYAQSNYTRESFSVDLPSQIDAKLIKQDNVSTQIERRINSLDRLCSQLEAKITDDRAIPSQVSLARRALLKAQIQLVLYNTRNLRVLVDFASRGTVNGLNWTSNTTAPGDFSVNNLNTDIVEQVWRGASGMKVGIQLSVDTEVTQGVFVDTLAILNHNLTSSAAISWQASNDNFASVPFTQALVSTRNNVYYIADMLPNVSYRYHRFLIDDVTNLNDSIQIGAIVFGSSVILQSENFTDQVQRKTTHFADKINTEAFTNVSNDRASKTSVTLEFRNLELNRGNYASLTSVFDEIRTSIKALWIPTPRYASRYAVFGKLTELPQESHNDLGEGQDYVSFSITIDESM